MNYDARYTGCPGCGAMEDLDCTCVGSDYEPTGLQARLAAASPVRCTCTEGEVDPRCPEHGTTIIRLASISLPFDSAEWIGREVRYAT